MTRFRGKRVPCALHVVLILLFAAWNAEAESFTCTDKLGRCVTVNVPVERAVVLQMCELIPVLRIWDKIVGIGSVAYDSDVIAATKPDVRTIVPTAGTGLDVNIEAILKLKPDVILTWTLKPDAITFMEKKGLNVVGVHPESLSELYGVIRLFGRLFGREDRVELCIGKMEDVLRLVEKQVSQIPVPSKRRVLWLSGKPTTVACGLNVSNDLVALAGGVNPASSIRQTNVDVSMERIIAWDPDLIFIWGHARYTAQTVLDSPQWRSVRAVREGKVYKVPRWSSWSPRVAPMVLWMAAKIYPEQFAATDVDRIIDDFYQEIFTISYKKVMLFER